MTMTTPVSSNSLTPPAAALELSQRQQVERALTRLPMGSTSHTVAQAPISRETLVNSVQQINEVLKSHGVKFVLEGEPPRTITQVVDIETGEKIRQIPSEETLAVSERLDELLGLLFQGEG